VLNLVIARSVATWQSRRRFRFLERQSNGKTVWIATGAHALAFDEVESERMGFASAFDCAPEKPEIA
jgi:hypothetical protein